MTSENKPALSLQLLYAKAGIMLATPGLALAAEAAVQQVARKGSLEALSAITWAFLFGFSLLGWAVSELDKVAELWNTDGRSQYQLWLERFKLLKSVAASVAAGIVVYFLGAAAPGLLFKMMGVASEAPPEFPEMVLFVFVAGAAYLGARLWVTVENRFMGAR